MKYTFQTVLVATDFSDVSLNAVRLAAAICKRQGATLRILHVVTHFDIAVPPIGHYAVVGPMIAESQNAQSARLQNLARQTGEEYGIACIADEATGALAEAIEQYATDNSCDLIVIGAVGASGLERLFLGSNTMAVLKRTSIPVLAVPKDARADTFRNILFPVRPVPNATDKYDVVRPIIERNGAKLHLVAVSPMGNPNRFMYVNALTSDLASKLNTDGVDFTVEKHYCEDVTDTILSLAEKKEADLLVITSTLEKDFWQLFSGPFSRKIIDRATTAVLLVRPGRSEAAVPEAARKMAVQRYPLAFG